MFRRVCTDGSWRVGASKTQSSIVVVVLRGVAHAAKFNSCRAAAVSDRWLSPVLCRRLEMALRPFVVLDRDHIGEVVLGIAPADVGHVAEHLAGSVAGRAVARSVK